MRYMSKADATASTNTTKMRTQSRPRSSRVSPRKTSGQMMYHCSSIASDQVCESGDASVPEKIRCQFST